MTEARRRMAGQGRSLQSTLDLVVALNRGYVRPEHLKPMAELYERAWQAPTFGTIHAPPQHGKTELSSAFLVGCLLRNPAARLVYATYEAKRAWRVSAKVRRKAQEAGVRLDDAVAAKDAWQTSDGGQFMATGVGGPLTGEPADIVLIDDPYRNRQQATSAAYAEMLRDWFEDVVESRTHKGSSIFVHHTRWHSDDLIGWIHAERANYQRVRLPALLEDGSILWPYRHDRDELLRRQAANPEHFEGLYQGEPPISAGQIFSLASYCPEDYPRQGRVGIGIDLAYSTKKRADSCALVVVREVSRYQEEPYYVVEHAEKQRVPLEDYEFRLRQIASRFPGAQMRWSGSSIEEEIARRLKASGLPIDFRRAVSDKIVRSEPAAMAWRTGQLVVPEGADYDVGGFVSEVTGFTGIEGRPDDYVDALGDAFAAVADDAVNNYLAWIKEA